MRPLSFKEALQNDVKTVFINPAEFGEPHKINGHEMMVVIDDLEHIEREKRMKSNMDGVYVKQVLFYVAAEDFGPLPAQGTIVKLDDKRYLVVDATDESGIYAITMEANKSR